MPLFEITSITESETSTGDTNTSKVVATLKSNSLLNKKTYIVTFKLRSFYRL
ncbi:hypothetical protein IMPR6_140048 [Imperialibacter sp. EC-SDR9]|nr:hypothetical protein IMPR6_140048 [Imperialibacter sp. EC-SDR9]